MRIALVFYDKGVVGDQVTVTERYCRDDSAIRAFLKREVKVLDNVKGFSEGELGSSTKLIADCSCRVRNNREGV